MNKAIKCMKGIVDNPSVKLCNKLIKVNADKRKEILLKKFKKCISKLGFEAELKEAEGRKIHIEFFSNDNVPVPFNFSKTINISLEEFNKKIIGQCGVMLSQHDDL